MLITQNKQAGAAKKHINRINNNTTDQTHQRKAQMVYRLLFTAFLLLWCLAAADPFCNITLVPRESGVRTPGQGTVRIVILNASLADIVPTNAASRTMMSSSTGFIVPQSVAFVTDQLPHFIQINLKNAPNYDIFENDAVSFSIPTDFFKNEVIGCPNLNFIVRPSPGVIGLDTLPLAVTETDINQEGVRFPLVIDFDQFLNANVTWYISRNVPGFDIIFELMGNAPSNVINVTILRNEDFNIPRYDELTLDISFPSSMIRSGETPIIGDEIFRYTMITLGIQGSKPFINTEYYRGDMLLGIPAENMWDGRNATIILRLLGDTWRSGMETFWANRTDGPKFEVSRPVQPSGFTFFLANNNWPLAVINNRTIAITFPETIGFALTTSLVETVDISNLESMMTEQMQEPCTGGCGGDDCFCANFRILKANTSSIRVKYLSPVFSNNMTESDIRRNGLNITVALLYDVFSTTAASNINIVRSFFVVNSYLSLDRLESTLSRANTQLVLYVPPQIGYNIAEGSTDRIELNFPRTLSATQSQLSDAQGRRSFNIQSVRTPTCRMPIFEITEADIRNRDVAVNISVAGDQFCFDPTPVGNPPTSPAIMRFLSGIRTKNIQFVLKSYTAQNLIVVFSRNYSYDISRTEIVAIPIPSELMCSLETCRADPQPLPPETSNSLTIPIRHVAGSVFGVFPTLDETYFRTKDLSVDIELRGETFAQGVFSPSWFVVTRDYERGFLGTIAGGCDGVRSTTNFSRATITCRRSTRYDISANETIRITIEPATVAGLLAPSSASVVPLVVTPVVGTVLSDESFRAIRFTEEEMIHGGKTIVISLLYERFNVTHLAAAFVKSITINGTADPLGILGSAADVFSVAGFAFNANQDQLFLTLQPAPNYDIMHAEAFNFSVDSDAVASKMAPYDRDFSAVVAPSPGRFETSGSAVFASARQVLEEELVLQVRLHNDVWLSDANFVVKDLCPLEKLAESEVPTCVVFVDGSNRVLTILFPPSERFSLYTNTTYRIPIGASYIRSGMVPPEVVSMFIYVSAGRISWSGPTVVTEDTIRGGSMGAITLKVGGDALADVRAVRASLVSSVTCVGSNDKYGFCGRAEYLFGDSFTLIGDARRQIQIKLQSNEDFDIYEPQNVTLRLSGEGLVSRFNPNWNESFTFQIIPTTGKFFISGFTDSITERDISGVTRKVLQMVLTLYGERWLSNKSKVIPILIEGISSEAATHETNGFMRYKSQIITADGSSISESGRVLTVQFAAVEDFDIYYDEKVSISVVGECVMSNMRPALSSSSNTFTILATGGLISMFPSTIAADKMRSEGVLLTLSVEGDQWKTDVVQNPVALLEAIRVGSSPQQEPSGFAVNVDDALTDIQSRGSSINGTSLIITLMPMPKYSIIKEETITLYLVQGWTTSGLPLVPNEFTLTVTPVFDFVEALLDLKPFIVYTAEGRETNRTTFVLSLWVDKVASMLSVSPSSIAVEYAGPEYLLPVGANPLHFMRVTFRVRSEDGTPFDNRAASNFVSYESSFLANRLNVLLSFFNNTPPSAEYWLTLRPAADETTVFSFPINKNIIYVFAAIIVVALVGVGCYLYYRSRTMLSGVSRAKETDRVGNRKVLQAEEDELRDREFDRAVYSGQSSGGSALLQDDDLSLGLLDNGERFSPLNDSSPTAVSRIKHEYELPMDLYAGQGGLGTSVGDAVQSTPPPLTAPEPLVLPFEEVADMELDLTAVYPRYTRASEMFLARKRRSAKDFL